MHTLADELAAVLRAATEDAFPELLAGDGSWPMELTQSTQEKFGHYQFNSAMRLAKMLQKNPRQIAEAICQQLNGQENSRFAAVEVAGPGFINLTLDPSFLTGQVQGMLEDPHLAVRRPDRPDRVVIDFSSPNIAKEMHVGHLRSTIIGDALARLLEFEGQDVLRLNHVGDWGTAFGMLIHYLKAHAPQVLTGEQTTDLSHLVGWYKESKRCFDEDADFKKASQLEVVQLQGGDPAARKAWELICEISRRAYQEIYDLLDIHLVERGESFYNPQLPKIIEDLEGKGLVDLSEGAKCVYLDGFKNREGEPLPLMVQKSDGGFNYATTDMACIRQRVSEEKADRVIYVTDAGQAQHFQMIFAAAEKAGYVDPSQVKLEHVGFGLVLGPDGKKFKTRSGETERLIDLLHSAVEKAREILAERNPDWTQEELASTARALGIGAVKYADLSCNRTGDYVFSYDRMLRFDGNTAAFIMYSYVRVNGIKRKCGVDSIDRLPPGAQIQLQHPSELSLGMHLCQFPEALKAMDRELLPNRLTDYLYGLAEKFNAFFRDCRVEGSEEQNQRLLLCEVVARVLRQGMEILGVPVVERM
ncbi:MAG: arginine--tRNA ligase [Chlamydiia bacterium]|nr:arginine--tRNA ligase [Chlamydiia bacterium]